MKILLVNYEYPPLGGGAANATQALAREFAAAGHDVRVLTSRFRGQPELETVAEGFTVERLPVWRRHMDRCAPPEMLTYIWAACRQSKSLLCQFRPDVVLAFFGIPGGPVAWWFRRRFGIPYLVYLLGGDVPGAKGHGLPLYHALTLPLSRRIWKKAAFTIPNSEGLAARARRVLPDYPFEVIPHGVDTALFHPRTKPDSDPSPVRMVFVGRIAVFKGLEFLVRALGQLARNPEMPDWELLLVGDGPDRPRIERMAADANLSDRLVWKGWVLKPEMPEVYRAADLFVFPSLDEGMPNVVLEAMASGLPVVGTKISGTEELVDPGVTGLLVEPGTVEPLQRALETALRDKAWREECGRAGRARAERLSWRAVADRFLALMEGVRTEQGGNR